MGPARAVALVTLALAIVLSGAAAAAAIRLTQPPGSQAGRQASAPRGRVLRFLAGSALLSGIVLTLVRDSLTLVAAWDGPLSPGTRGVLLSLGAGSALTCILLLNALARPRGVAPAWALILAAPLLYLQVVAPLGWVVTGRAPSEWAAVAVPVVAGTVAGGYLFLTTLVFLHNRERHVRGPLVALGIAASLQGAAAAVLVATGGSTVAAGYVALADAVTMGAVAAGLIIGCGTELGLGPERVVTLTPEG